MRWNDGGGSEGFVYSARGLVAHTNQLGKVTSYAYDALGRKTNEVLAAVTTNRFTYSASGELLTLADGNGSVTTWRYDAFCRMTNKVDHLGSNMFFYTNDANGRLVSRTTPQKGTTFYGYDSVGNLTSINYPNSPDITLSYDPLNRLTNMVDASGTNKYDYVHHDLLSEDGPWASDTVTYTNVNRLRKSLTVAHPTAAAWTQTHAYDGIRRLTNITSPAGAFGYHYSNTPSLLPLRLGLPGGSYITNAYDVMARLLNTQLKNSSQLVLNSHAYGYNAGNQRTTVSNFYGNAWDYTYDPIGQLVTAKGKDGATNRLHEQFGYAYDPAGNLQIRTNNALVQNFAVNALNQLTTSTRTGTLTVGGVVNIPATNVTVNGQTASRYLDSMFAKDGFSIVTNGWNSFTAIAQTNGKASTNTINAYLPVSNSYQYDLNGNLTNLAGVPTAQQLALGYDDENQLTSVIAPGLWKGEFTYDGKMRLRVRKEYRWTGSSWALTNETRTVQDGMLVVQERNSANVPTITYTRGRDLSGSLQGAGGIGGLLAMTEAAQPLYPHSYYHADGNGNVTALVGTNGAVVARYAYDAFGNTTLATGGKAQINRYRFSSKEHHDRSGLVYYGYRWYVPEVQRWVNRDPIGNKGGINLYGFIRNDPMINLDPNGLTVLPIIILPPPLTPSDCSALRDFLSDQQTMKQAYENALGTCLPVVFPPGATTIANPGMLGCFQIRDPGSRAVCIAHERSHWTQVPGLLWDMLNCPNTTCAQMDLAYQNEINAYEAGIRAGSLLYIQNCTHVSIST